MPTKRPRGQELTVAQKQTNHVRYHRWRRIEHVHRRVKRCRIITDQICLWKESIRDAVMKICGAMHNFHVRLTPWNP